MWRNPRLVTDLAANGLWHTARSSSLDVPELTTTNVQASEDDSDAARLLTAWLNEAIELIARHASEIRTQTRPTNQFKIRLERFLVRETKAIARRQDFAMFSDVFRPAYQLSGILARQGKPQLGEGISMIAYCLASAALVLAGSESKSLVGFRQGVPAWKSFPALKSNEVGAHLASNNLVTFGLREHIGKDDVWMVPTTREFDAGASESNALVGEFLETNHALIEYAFSAQRYLVDPDGVYVKLTDARNVTGIHLKARAGDNHDLVELLVRFETDNGSFFTVINEERLLHPEEYRDSYPSIDTYYAYLACQVYHDLVTSSEVPLTSPAKAGSNGPVATPRPRQSYSWIVIPRRPRNGTKPTGSTPRTAIPGAKPTPPRRVTGHPRKRPMTAAHRKVLEQFERETGVCVLRYVPEGSTFVRPHFSPALTGEEFKELPRFIRYRIQESLIALMQSGPSE